MATVVCRLRGRGACMGIMGTVRFMRGVWARLGIPRGFAVPLGGGARGGRFTAEVKPINPTDNKPTNPKTNSAARLEESAAAPTGQSVRDF